jgi:hypothetical protein
VETPRKQTVDQEDVWIQELEDEAHKQVLNEQATNLQRTNDAAAQKADHEKTMSALLLKRSNDQAEMKRYQREIADLKAGIPPTPSPASTLEQSVADQAGILKKIQEQLDVLSTPEKSKGKRTFSGMEDDSETDIGKSIFHDRDAISKLLQTPPIRGSLYVRKHSLNAVETALTNGKPITYDKLYALITNSEKPMAMYISTDAQGNKAVHATDGTRTKIQSFSQILKCIKYLHASLHSVCPEAANEFGIAVPNTLSEVHDAANKDIMVTKLYADTQLRLYLDGLHHSTRISLEFDSDLLSNAKRDIDEVRREDRKAQGSNADAKALAKQRQRDIKAGTPGLATGEECRNYQRGLPCKVFDKKGNCRFLHTGVFGAKPLTGNPPAPAE